MNHLNDSARKLNFRKLDKFDNYCIKLFFFLKTKFTKDYLMIFIIQDKLSNTKHLEELKSENKNVNKIKIGSLHVM